MDEQPMTLQRLLDEPKGKTTFRANQAFLLQVFWEAPNQAAAEDILRALEKCGRATHRDTPCVPTYLFRISRLDQDLCSAPSTVSEHPQLREALKKLQVGVPRPAVELDLRRRNIDPALLDAGADSPLPAEMRESSIILELTELYLDERCFYEHAGSRDYLDAYGDVMKPGLQNTQATIRYGTPTSDIVDKILHPLLKEKPMPSLADCTLWRRPQRKHEASSFVSIDMAGMTAEEVAQKVPERLRAESTTCITFAHPLREKRFRVLCVLSRAAEISDLEELAMEQSCFGMEVRCSDEGEHQELARAAEEASLASSIFVTNTHQSGYILHEKAHEVSEE